jgi:hypothetical protein
VYREADKIRRANLNENIALEDIAEELMERAILMRGPGLKFDLAEARQSFLGFGSLPSLANTALH